MPESLRAKPRNPTTASPARLSGIVSRIDVEGTAGTQDGAEPAESAELAVPAGLEDLCLVATGEIDRADEFPPCSMAGAD